MYIDYEEKKKAGELTVKNRICSLLSTKMYIFINVTSFFYLGFKYLNFSEFIQCIELKSHFIGQSLQDFQRFIYKAKVKIPRGHLAIYLLGSDSDIGGHAMAMKIKYGEESFHYFDPNLGVFEVIPEKISSMTNIFKGMTVTLSAEDFLKNGGYMTAFEIIIPDSMATHLRITPDKSAENFFHTSRQKFSESNKVIEIKSLSPEDLIRFYKLSHFIPSHNADFLFFKSYLYLSHLFYLVLNYYVEKENFFNQPRIASELKSSLDFKMTCVCLPGYYQGDNDSQSLRFKKNLARQLISKYPLIKLYRILSLNDNKQVLSASNLAFLKFFLFRYRDVLSLESRAFEDSSTFSNFKKFFQSISILGFISAYRFDVKVLTDLFDINFIDFQSFLEEVEQKVLTIYRYLITLSEKDYTDLLSLYRKNIKFVDALQNYRACPFRLKRFLEKIKEEIPLIIKDKKLALNRSFRSRAIFIRILLMHGFIRTLSFESNKLKKFGNLLGRLSVREKALNALDEVIKFILKKSEIS